MTLAMAVGPAAAQPLASAGPAVTTVCQGSRLQISIPERIPADPGVEVNQVAWHIVLRNGGTRSCALSGWPAITVLGSGGRTVPTTVTDVQSGELGAVPDAPVTLRPGGSAVVTVLAPARAPGCITRWSLRVGLPGTRQQLSVAEPGALRGSLCAGGQLRVTPLSLMSALTAAAQALRSPAAVSSPAGQRAFPATLAAAPPACSVGALQAQVAANYAGRAGSLVLLRLTADTPCVILSGGWPTIRLRMSAGLSTVAKAFAYRPATQQSRTAYTTYDQISTTSAPASAEASAGSAMTARTAVTLRPGSWVSAVLLAPAGPGRCRRARSATVYPSVLAVGPGLTVPFTRPVSICGQPQILPFLPGGQVASALPVGRGALAAAQPGRGPAAMSRRAGDGQAAAVRRSAVRAGFWHGSDGPLTMACGAPPYREAAGATAASISACAATNGYYGVYLGEIGKWDDWQDCPASTISAWNSSDYAAAEINDNDYAIGVGAGAYWMMAGPGRDPDYRSARAAIAWGQSQAAEVAREIGSTVLSFPYVFMDIEQYSSGVDDSGWSTAFGSACGARPVSRAVIPASVKRDTVSGFSSWLLANTSLLPAVYSGGGDSAYEWDGIFGPGASAMPTDTAEWTFSDEMSSFHTFPSEFSGSGVTADWFAQEPQGCQLIWQWTGGAVQNSMTNFRADQVDANRDSSAACK